MIRIDGKPDERGGTNVRAVLLVAVTIVGCQLGTAFLDSLLIVTGAVLARRAFPLELAERVLAVLGAAQEACTVLSATSAQAGDRAAGILRTNARAKRRPAELLAGVRCQLEFGAETFGLAAAGIRYAATDRNIGETVNRRTVLERADVTAASLEALLLGHVHALTGERITAWNNLALRTYVRRATDRAARRTTRYRHALGNGQPGYANMRIHVVVAATAEHGTAIGRGAAGAVALPQAVHVVAGLLRGEVETSHFRQERCAACSESAGHHTTPGITQSFICALASSSNTGTP